jgi:hypothetical protein
MATESTDESSERENGASLLARLWTAATRREAAGLPSVLHVWRSVDREASFTRAWWSEEECCCCWPSLAKPRLLESLSVRLLLRNAETAWI